VLCYSDYYCDSEELEKALRARDDDPTSSCPSLERPEDCGETQGQSENISELQFLKKQFLEL
jgi:hypothetical protein